MRKLLSLMRVHQWYKNLLVFLPIIFGEQLLNIAALQKTAGGFACLCLVSSANYILNDIFDRKRDRFHPDFRKKCLATGEVKAWQAFAAAAILIAASFWIACSVSAEFTYFAAALFIATFSYSVALKKEIFIDVLLISLNFVIRAVSGAYVIMERGNPYIWVSPWLIVCTFFLAFLLASGKRSAELRILKEKAPKYRPVLRLYTPAIADALLHISTASLIISYALYSFLGVNPGIIYTAPIAFYAALRYLYLVETGSAIPLHLHTFYNDKRLLAGIFLWAISAGIVIYFM